MAETQIEWTDSTWNPVAGCSIVTAGCTHCYAMEMAKRLEGSCQFNADASRQVEDGLLRARFS